MHVLEVNGPRPFVRVILGNHLPAQVEQVSLTILFEDRPEDPAVAVIVGELRVLELRIQLGDFLQEIQVAP